MLNRTGRRAGLTASPWAWRGVVLAGALVAAQPAVTFGAGVDTYQWLGELVALDEGARTLTVTSRVVAPAGLDVAGLEPGDPILITWSGSEHGAQAISAVVADDGSGLSPRNHFRLRARFVAADAARQSLTFSVSGPASALAPLRATTQGTWTTVTSPHRPAHGPAAVVTADAYGAGDGRGPAPGDQYRWHGELVSLDNAGRLTVKARLASPTAAAAGLEAGDAIRITWSGFRERASGIRAVVPADDSGLWGSDRFLLEAELVAIDQRYLTFSVEPPADSIAAIRALTPGAWATATSPHQPMAAAEAVEAVTAYAASPADVPRTAEATYRWHGELVSLDDAGSKLTVKSRLVFDAAAESAADLDAGDPIVITWSGFENRTDGIRAVERDAGLWGDGGFLLQATFVETDPARRYMTFSVEPPADRVRGLRAMTRGSWATLTSHHRPAAAGDSPVLTVDAYAPSTAPRLAGMAPAADDTYGWHGELVSRDEEAGTLTVRSRIVAPSGTVADDLQAGDPIVITWSGFEDRADGIRAVKRDDGSGLWGNDRFLLQAEFTAVEGRYLTFTVEPPADSAPMMQGLTPGAWANGTSPHRPDSGVDAVTMVDAYDPALRARRYVWNGELVALDKAKASLTVSAPVEEHVFRYVDRFSKGDQVVLIWTPGNRGESRAIRYLELREQSVLKHGYVLPVEFVSADEDRRRITFTTPIPARTVAALSDAEPGDWITATSLFDQSYEHAAIIAMEAEGGYAEE